MLPAKDCTTYVDCFSIFRRVGAFNILKEIMSIIWVEKGGYFQKLF